MPMHLMGQLACLAALLLWTLLVPWMPQVTGLPKHRVLEMLVFWSGWGLLLVGIWLRPAAAAIEPGNHSGHWSARLAATGILLAAWACLLSLTNLLFSSVQGAGIRVPGFDRAEILLPDSAFILDYVLLAFFVPSLLWQIPWLFVAHPLSSGQANPIRPLRLILLVFFGLGLGAFGLTCLMFLANRWYALFCVIVTWLASWLFILLAYEHYLWAKGPPSDHDISHGA